MLSFLVLGKTRHICDTIIMNRTVKIQLHPTAEQEQMLLETMQQFTSAYNAVLTYGWQHKQKNGVKLHHALYYQMRTDYPQLTSNILVQARVKATETLKSAFTWQAKQIAAYQKKVAKAKKRGLPVPAFKPVKMPQSRLCPVRYNERTYTLSWTEHSTRLSTTQGYIAIPFTVPPFSTKYQGHPIATAELCYRKGKFWLHVVVDVPEPILTATQDVIGVDLGLNRPAVTSKHHFLGSRCWKEVDRRCFRLKRKLQSKGSKSAKRHLRKLKGKQARFHRDCDHVLSKQIVSSVAPGSTIVLENLSGIRESSKIGRGKNNKTVDLKRQFHSWTFAQLYGFISYKAAEHGIRVERVDPRHTSQTCSRCGYQHCSNRRSQSLFLCRQCGYQLNADLNAAMNIREKYLTSLAQDGRPVLSGLAISEPIVSDLRA